MAYAEKTRVPISQTKAEIEKLLWKYGATRIATMNDDGISQIAFHMAGRNLLFRIHLPEKEQERRSLWRALLLTIKAKLESAERGIETFEQAFLANIVLPGGRTVSDEVAPAIEAAYRGNDVPLLPDYRT